MEDIKYIITNGCSFTREYSRIGLQSTCDDFLTEPISFWKWPHFIQKEYPNYKVLNYGCPTNDNDVIAKSTLYGIKKLLDDNVSTKDIKVMVQWSTWSRSSFFISKEKQESDRGYKLNNDFSHINDFISDKKSYPGEHGYYVLSGGYHIENIKNDTKLFFEEYIKYQLSADERMIQFFQSILLVQSFCKSNNIEYMFLNMHNNFSNEYTKDLILPNWKPINSVKSEPWHILYEKFIPITWRSDNEIQFKNRPHIKWLYDLIDFDKFWFYVENGITKYGGLVEWAIKSYKFDETSDNENVPNILWGEYKPKWDLGKRNKEDMLEFSLENNYWQHPSPYANRKFVKEELISFLGKPPLNTKLI
jgi:hypothetical protein